MHVIDNFTKYIKQAQAANDEWTADLSEQIMKFRSGYLEFIADAWNDETLQQKYLSRKDPATGKMQYVNVLGNPEWRERYLPDGFYTTWGTVVYLLDTHSFDSKFDTLYDPEKADTDNGWFGVNDLMVINLPKKPEGALNQQKGLAHFYEHFNNLLGNYFFDWNKEFGGPTGPKETQLSVEELEQVLSWDLVNIEQYQAAMDRNSPFGAGVGGPAMFLTFGVFWLEVLAKCWTDPEFKNNLLSKPIEVCGQPGARVTVDDKTTRVYENPWALKMLARESSEDGSQIANALYLSFPYRPDGTEDERTVALSRYNSTGPEYPFTCTC